MVEYDQRKISLKELLRKLLLAEKELPVVSHFSSDIFIFRCSAAPA